MRSISLHVDEDRYRELKRLAEETGRPVTELIRDAIAAYRQRHEVAGSVFDLAPHPSGRVIPLRTRAEILDETLGR